MLGDDSQTLNCKVNVLMDRMFLLGFLHPSEASVRQLAGLLAAMHAPSADPSSLKGIVDSVKQAMHARRCAGHPSMIRNYPTSPRDLPAPLFAHVYTAGEPVVAPTIPNLTAITSRIPLRITNKSLGAPAAPQQLAMQPFQPAAPSAAQPDLASMFQNFAHHPAAWQLYMQMMGNQAPQPPTPPSPLIQLLTRSNSVDSVARGASPASSAGAPSPLALAALPPSAAAPATPAA